MKLDVHFMSDLVQSEKRKDETTLDQNLEMMNEVNKNSSTHQVQAEEETKKHEAVRNPREVKIGSDAMLADIAAALEIPLGLSQKFDSRRISDTD